MRHGAVRADALYLDVEPVGVRHALPGRARHGAGGHFAPDVRAVDGVDAFERAGFDHGKRADGDFLGRLEDDAHFADKLIGNVAQDAHGAEHHGHVRIVAARVHDAGVFGRERRARVLGDGQRVHIGAQGHAVRRGAVGAVRTGRRAADGGDYAVVFKARVLNSQVRKLFAQQLLRVFLVARRFGEAVEQPARGDDVGLGRGAKGAHLLDSLRSRSGFVRLRECGTCGDDGGHGAPFDGAGWRSAFRYWLRSVPHACCQREAHRKTADCAGTYFSSSFSMAAMWCCASSNSPRAARAFTICTWLRKSWRSRAVRSILSTVS